jgi:16S rRNA (guanine527-N7)-methyltransferase
MSYPLSTVRQALDSGLQALGLPAGGSGARRLLRYLELLEKWNRTYNLTAVRELQAMVTRLILDSLSAHPFLRGDRVLDVGSGAGLPGIPLAIFNPDREFVLLDSNGKKIRFMRHAVMDLGLPNVAVEQGRAEQYHPTALFDTVISRALGSLGDLAATAGHLCRGGGHLLALKGRYPKNELAELPPGYRAVEVQRLQVPGLDAERHLVDIRRI